ncbi:MAG: DJ-1/PfpI family protein [Gemmatimonadetes bacterium]|nr:DJ-1/PfpI family protein [Gemmatimonadota bacterium]
MTRSTMTRRVFGAVVALLALAHPVRAQVNVPDFDAAMRGLRFAPATTDFNNGAGGGGNGMLDAEEMALITAILRQPAFDLSARGGVTRAKVEAALQQARATAKKDIAALVDRWPTAPEVVAGYVMLGRASFEAYDAMSKGFGAPLTGDYSLALALDRYLGPNGDADGDGVPNRHEYQVHFARGRDAWVKAALDPSERTRPALVSTTPAPKEVKTVGIVLYPGFEVLDVYGPVEMWSYVPEFKVVMIAEQAGPVRSAQGVSTVAEYSFANAPTVDILMVPGGVGTYTQLKNAAFLDFIRARHAVTSYTTSVCTGSALLARAGLLKGLRATSNKGAFALAVEQDPEVKWVPSARWVEDGKVLTSSGVSAGTDMALGLVSKMFGIERARGLARSLEYEWHEDRDADPFGLKEVPKVFKP